MAEQHVSILIDALDRARGTIGQVMKDLNGIGPSAEGASRNLGRTSQALRATEGAAGALGAALQNVGKILLAAFTVEKFVEMTKRAMETTHEMVMLSEAVGATADEMVRFVRAGAEHGLTMEKFGFAARTFSRALIEAQDPTSKQAIIFRQMEQDSGKAIIGQRDFMTALLNTADAFKRYESTPERAALAMDLFSRASGQMIPLMLQGGDAIREAMGRVEGLTEEQRKATEDWEVMTVRMENLFQGIGLRIGTAVLPHLEKLVSWLNTSIRSTGEWNNGLEALKQVLNGVAAAVALTYAGVMNLIDAWGTMSRVAGEMSRNPLLKHLLLGPVTNLILGDDPTKDISMTQALAAAQKELNGLRDRAAARSESAFATAKNLLGVTEKQAAVEHGITQQKEQQLKTEQQELKKAAMDNRPELRQKLKDLDYKRQDAEREYQKELLNTQALLQQGAISKNDAFERDKLAAAALAAEIGKLNDQLREFKGRTTDPDLNREIQLKLDQGAVQQQQSRLAASAPGVNDWSAQWHIAMQQMRDELALTAQKIAQTFRTTLHGAIETVADGITDAIYKTKSWGQALLDIEKAIGRSIVNAIVKMAAEWVAQRAIMGMASIMWSTKEGAADVAAKTPGALMSSISSYGVAAVVGLAALLAALGAVGAFAEGGPVTGGIAGKDSVPALLTPGEFVIPRDVVSRMGAGYFESLRRGQIPTAQVNSVPTPNRSGLFAVGGLVGQPTAAGGSKSAAGVDVVFFDDRNKMRDYLQSRDGQRELKLFIRGNRMDLGIG